MSAEISPSNADPGTYEQAECGCEFWTQGGEGGQFVFRPHSLRCPLYLYAFAESRRQGNQIRFRVE